MTLMSGLPIALGILISAVVAVATVVACRLLAHRASAAGEIQLIGDVPPVTDWLPGALTSFAAASPGASTSFEDDTDGGILRGHRAVVRMPSGGVQLALRMQPHLVLEARSASHPVVIITDLVEAPTRSGLSRVIFGATPTSDALATRASLQGAIAAAARNRGMVARATHPTGGAPAFAVGLGLVVICLALTLFGPTARLVSRLTEPPAPWNPTGSTECPPASTKAKPPASTKAKPPASTKAKPPASKKPSSASGPVKRSTRTAAPKGTSCAFAESVRAAYAKAKISGSTVKLGKIAYDKATKVAVTCTAGPTYTTCRGREEGGLPRLSARGPSARRPRLVVRRPWSGGDRQLRPPSAARSRRPITPCRDSTQRNGSRQRNGCDPVRSEAARPRPSHRARKRRRTGARTAARGADWSSR